MNARGERSIVAVFQGEGGSVQQGILGARAFNDAAILIPSRQLHWIVQSLTVPSRDSTKNMERMESSRLGEYKSPPYLLVYCRHVVYVRPARAHALSLLLACTLDHWFGRWPIST